MISAVKLSDLCGQSVRRRAAYSFQNLNDYLDTQLIQIEVLRHRRGDGYSDPKYVIELLEEYIDVSQGDLIPKELPKAFTEK